MWQQSRGKGGIITSVVLSTLLVICAILIIFFRQHIVDQIIVWQFKPSGAIVTLSSRVGLNDNGKFIFYASQPELNSAADFNSVCKRIENTTSILGCYSNSKIYIYNVTDTQLDGIREVTAAHEMLHAAYQRLGDDEKKSVDALLEAEYKKLESDKQFAELIAFYARTEPGERDNELHSIIGTVTTSVDPALETYYQKYFSNRQDTVALYTKYNGVFQTLTDRANTLSDQLNSLASSITADSAQYNTDIKTLNDDIVSFNSRAENGGFSSQYQFNTERAALSARVTKLNATRTNINNDVDRYNTLLAEYNSIATQSKKLYNSIDSTLAPTPSV